MRRARDAEREQQNRDQPLFRRSQDPRGHRGHRVAPEAKHHRQDRLTVQPHDAKDAIAEDGETRDVAAVLEKPEHQEERGDHGQDDRDRVRHAHRDEPVLADEEVADQRDGDEAIDQPDGRRVDPAAEHIVFEQLDERLRAEHTDEQIHGVEHGGKDGQARQRPARRPCQRLRDVHQRQRGHAADARSQLVGPGRAIGGEGVRWHMRHTRRRQRIAQFGESAAFDRDEFHDGNPQFDGERRRVDGDPALKGLVDHVQREHHRLSERRELAGQHQRPPYIAGVRHLHDYV